MQIISLQFWLIVRPKKERIRNPLNAELPCVTKYAAPSFMQEVTLLSLIRVPGADEALHEHLPAIERAVIKFLGIQIV